MFHASDGKTYPSLKDILVRLVQRPEMAGYIYVMSTLRLCYEETIETACAGYGFIFFNPHFFNGLQESSQCTVLVHEIMHIYGQHLDRVGDRDKETFNIAADHVINNTLHSEGFDFDELPNAFRDPQYAGNATETVYDIIYDKPPESSGGDGGKDGDSGDFGGSAGAIYGLSETTPSNDKIKDLISQRGDIDKIKKEFNETVVTSPGDVELGETIYLEPTSVIKDLDYKSIFQDYLTEGKVLRKRTMLRPSRRPAPVGVVLPGYRKSLPKRGKLQHLVYALDVSGSISSNDIGKFKASLEEIRGLLKPDKLTLVFWECVVREVIEITPRTDISALSVTGGGGTDLKPVYKYLEKSNPEVLVTFTDGFVGTYPPKPSWESIWLLTNSCGDVPPYGTVSYL